MKTPNEPIVIVGGGTMGLFLAHELMLRNVPVIIIEAGTESIQTFDESEYQIIGHPHSGTSIGRSKGLGGTSNLWGGQLAEFIQADFDNKNTYSQPAWPVDWKDIKPFFSKVYEKLGLKIPVDDYSSELFSMDGNIKLELFHTYWLKSPSFLNHFLNDLKESPIVTIMTNTIVSNLLFEGDVCKSMEVYNENIKKNISDFSAIVLANGTIEICRLLLISAKDDNCPFKTNPHLGKYFQDHLNLRVGKIQNVSKSFFEIFSNFVKNGNKLQPKLRLNSLLPDKDYIGVCGYFSFSSDVSQHLDNFKQFFKAITGRSHSKLNLSEQIKLFFKAIRALPKIFPLMLRYLKDNRIYIPFNSTVTLCLQTQQITHEKSYISIDEENLDGYGRPKAIVNWAIEGGEFDRINLFCAHVGEYLEKNKLGKLELEKWLGNEGENRNDSWKYFITDIYHQAGGTIMSDQAEKGVVDVNSKMFYTRNLFICGASIMPTSGYANTSLTSLAFTYRLAESLCENRGI